MYTLDPLLESLMNYASDEDLTHKLKSLFQRFDIDEDSVITYQEMYEGLHKLEYQPPIALPLQEYELITGGGMVDGDGCLSFSAFSAVLREQLKLFCQETIPKGCCMVRYNTDFRMLTFENILQRRLGNFIASVQDDSQQGMPARTRTMMYTCK